MSDTVNIKLPADGAWTLISSGQGEVSNVSTAPDVQICQSAGQPGVGFFGHPLGPKESHEFSMGSSGSSLWGCSPRVEATLALTEANP